MCKSALLGFPGTEAGLNPAPACLLSPSAVFKNLQSFDFCVFSCKLMKPEKIYGEKTLG